MSQMPPEDSDDRTVIIPSPHGRAQAAGRQPAPTGVTEALPPAQVSGLNPLLAAANPLLDLIPQLRATLQHPDPMGLRDALIRDAHAEVGPEVIDDALAAAAMMAMNNVYYRFRHLVGKPSYSQMPARLRMQRIARPATNKADFELFCLAVSAINGCEMCITSHEDVVIKAALSEDQVHDAVRIAAVVTAAAVALELPVWTAEATASAL